MPHLVCVIDDEPEVCDLLRITLETRGYNVITCRDGQTGWRTVQERRPDLVILDVLMPGLNGYEVLAKIRSSPELAALPVILITSLTARSLTSDAEWKERTEVTDFLTKPFDPLVLLQRIEAILAPAAPEPQTPGR